MRGAFDPIREIADVAHAEGLWHHVDAAWGGSALFSAKYRSLMDGIELADSMCWDAHKMMGIPLICSAFLIKDKDVLSRYVLTAMLLIICFMKILEITI